MNRSQKFLGITLMASLLCGFTPMQSEAKEYKIGGMYTYDYHDGRHADWGEYELHAAKMAIVINGMKTSGKKRDNLGSIGKSFRRGCNSIAESATKKEGNQPSFFVGG